MKVILTDVSETTGLVEFYNEQINLVPYCYPVSSEVFERGIKHKLNEYEGKNQPNEKSDVFSIPKLIIGEDNGEISGFAHIEGLDEGKDGPIGFIRFMNYRPDRHQVGQAILKQAEQYFYDLKLNKIKTFIHTKYNFFRFGSGGLPYTMCHVQALFSINDYKVITTTDGIFGCFFFHYPQYHISEPICPDLKLEANIQQESGNGELPNLEIQLYRDEQLVAFARSASAEHYCLAKEARTTFYTELIQVDDGEQGKGIGRYLMQLTLWEMKKLGYHSAVIHSEIPNYRAHLFLTSLGYSFVDANCVFYKDI